MKIKYFLKPNAKIQTDIQLLLWYHIGDLGNIEADENGTAILDIILNYLPRPTLYEGDNSILNRTLVIHEGK